MAAAMALTVAQTLLAALDSSVLKEVCSMFEYKSQLEELKDTVTTIKAVLLDADAKQEELSHGYQDWINKLKDALYDVNDLFDEFNTIAQQQRQLGGCGWNNISEKVRRFFSHSNQVLVAFNIYQQTKKNKKKLAAIASNHTKFGLSATSVGFECQPMRRRQREETPSYVDEKRIFGRDNDKNNIVEMLLDSNVSDDVSFVTIVGMGGLGKTTLAQLVYNYGRIVKEFHELQMWVSVSDNFDVKQILRMMLMSATNQKYDELGMDPLGTKFREIIQGKRYLLVLDDVWEENPHNWTVLIDFLKSGGRGSKILVTSRSKMVGRAVGNAQMYELKGLAEKDSWLLFKKMAFDKGREHADADLVEIGRDIIKKCANVPLSIRVVGSLLWGKEKEKWLLFQTNDLAKIQKAHDQTMAILRSSYYHLSPPLKSCFSCCALFPKDHDIKKIDLIHLWMACGFLAPHNGQSIEDVGEDYFSILMQRCFFQDIVGKGYSVCKVHDLMHDLALEVGGRDLLVLPSATHDFDRKIRYLSILEVQENIPLADTKTSHVILQLLRYEPRFIGEDGVSKIISHGRRLRFLDLRGVSSRRTMPSGIGRLIHLRYLDLSSWTRLEMLPRSITKLHNLQVLKLTWCQNLRALPDHFSRLVNLRYMNISYCKALSHMPTGMRKLTCLHTLTRFVVGGDSEKVQMSHLEDLKALVNLKDDLTIEIKEFRSNETSKIKRGAYLLDKQHLKELGLVFGRSYWQGQEDVEEALLEGFQPNHNLRKMEILWYNGVKFPTWPSWENTIRSPPLLAKIKLSHLPRLQHLPSFSQLRSLEELELFDIPNLEYMESESSYVSSAHWTFYPSLRELFLENLPKVKGWWRDGVMADAEGDGRGCSSSTREQGGGNGHEMSSLLLFSNLSRLNINECPSMKLFPPCPHVEELNVKEFNAELVFGGRIRTMEIEGYAGVKFPSWTLWENPMTSLPLLVKIELENLPRLQHLPSFSQLRSLETLSLWDIPNLEYMESESSCVSSAHWTFYPSLRKLSLGDLPKVKGWWRDGVMVDAEGDGRGCSSSTREQGGGNGHEMSSLLLFPNLSRLTIKECPSMKLFPPCPHVEGLTLKEFNEELVFGERIERADNHNQTSGLSTTTASSGDTAADTGVESVRVVPQVVALKKLQIDNSGFMSRLPEESIQGLRDLKISWSEEERLSTAEVFRSCASSLQFLEIKNCRKLKSVRGGGIEHLTYLQTLQLVTCDELELEDEDENGTPWNCLHNLSFLSLWELPRVANLPKGIQFSTALHSLGITNCSGLRALPEWLGCLSSLRSLWLSHCDELKSLPEAMRDLTSLTRLEITGCPHLNDRCRRPDGEDWPKICHVSNIIVNDADVFDL